MTTELNIKITAETAEDAMLELATLSFRVGQELGVVPRDADTVEALMSELSVPEVVVEKANGGEPPPAKAAKAKPAKKATPAPEPEPEPAPKVDRETVLAGLTKLYGDNAPESKERKLIREFRDGRGVERLRDLKDEDIPEAAALLAHLKLEAEVAP